MRPGGCRSNQHRTVIRGGCLGRGVQLDGGTGFFDGMDEAHTVSRIGAGHNRLLKKFDLAGGGIEICSHQIPHLTEERFA